LSTGSVVDANVNVVEVLKKVYPVGCIYTSTVSTNPNTLFGFGTWSEYGQGRVLVGKSAEAEFDTAGKTGGAKTHTLTEAEMPQHTHIQNSHRHNVVWSADYRVSLNQAGSSGYKLDWNSGAGDGNLITASVTATNQNTGSGNAHNNLQPYIVVYFWKREN